MMQNRRVINVKVANATASTLHDDLIRDVSIFANNSGGEKNDANFTS